jgi:hypothetical protein
VQSLDGKKEVPVDTDIPAVAALVFKVCVALEAETQFADGRLDWHGESPWLHPGEHRAPSASRSTATGRPDLHRHASAFGSS